MFRLRTLALALLCFGVFAPTFSTEAVANPAAVVTTVAQPTGSMASVASDVAVKEVAAPEPVQETGTAGVVKTLIKYGIELLATVLLALLSGLSVVLLRKWGFEASTSKVQEVLEASINFAKQKAIKAAKADGAPTSNAEKMELAKQFAIGLASEWKLKEKGEQWWEDQLESWIGKRKSERQAAGVEDREVQKKPRPKKIKA